MSSSQVSCTFFAAGNCRAGSRCPYEHDRKAARADTSASVPLPCKFFREGCCKAGRSCRFSHQEGLKDPKPQSISMLCKYFADGLCSQGKMCAFRHDRKLVAERNKPKAPATCVQKARTKKTMLPKAAWTQENPIKLPEERPTTEEAQANKTTVEWATDQDAVFFYGAPGTLESKPREQNLSYRAVARSGLEEEELESSVLPHKPKELCSFYQQGSCRYGASCHFRHEKAMDDVELGLMEQELEYSKELECGICLEVVLSKECSDKIWGWFGLCTRTKCLGGDLEYLCGCLIKEIGYGGPTIR